MSETTTPNRTGYLAQLDQQHVWHPFTPMRQWRQTPPTVIERGDGPYIYDTDDNRYIDGVSSIWCNVHGHRCPEIDDAIRDQLDKIAHSTLLGLASPPSIEFADMLCQRTPGTLNKVFYSDAGATALELAFKMAVGYWYHRGKPNKGKFIGLREAYHGDTVGAMSVGYSDLFHRPFLPMVFNVTSFDHPDPVRPPEAVAQKLGPHDYASGIWPSEDPARAEALKEHCLADLDRMLEAQAHETAAVVIEPLMQGAAGMICQPPGFLKGVEQLCRKHEVLLIADEVAVGFGRTGKLFAVEHEDVQPDLLCLAKGISGGYLPLAATVATDEIDDAFTGEIADKRTLYHGHTYTGNALACAAAVASLKRFEEKDLLSHIDASAQIIHRKLRPLLDCPNVLDVRRRGLMTGIEIGQSRPTTSEGAESFDFSKRTAAAVCQACLPKGLFVRPLGDVMILMPMPAMEHEVLEQMLDTVVETVREYPF